LEDLEVNLVFGRVLLQPVVDFFESDVSIDLRFPAAQQVKVWAVEHQNARH
jgi:hypothetical protein